MPTNEKSLCIQSDSSVHYSLLKKSDTTTGNDRTPFLYVHAPHTQNKKNPSISRFEVFRHDQTLCGKPDLFIQNNVLTFW